jgi:hypothetical protein
LSGPKLEEIKRKDLRKPQEYRTFGLEDCRMAFRLDCRMVECRANMKTRYKNDIRCRACAPANNNIETQEHLEICSAYQHLHKGLDIIRTEGNILIWSFMKEK